MLWFKNAETDMELNLKISYHQLLSAIKELSPKDFLKLKKELTKINPVDEPEKGRLQDLLANGPVMNDEQYDEFLENRKKFSEWRRN